MEKRLTSESDGDREAMGESGELSGVSRRP